MTNKQKLQMLLDGDDSPVICERCEGSKYNAMTEPELNRVLFDAFLASLKAGEFSQQEKEQLKKALK